MVMAAADQVKRAGGGEVAGLVRIVADRYAQAAGFETAVGAVVVETREDGGASGGDQVLVAGVVAVDQVDGAVEPVEAGQHERRDQVTAVDEKFGALAVRPADGPP